MNKKEKLSKLENLEKRVNKLATRLWAGVFFLMVIVLAGGFFVFSSFNFKMVTQAFVNKNSGDALTAAEWNSLDVDFITTESDPTVQANVKDGVSWSEITGAKSIGRTGCYDKTVDQGNVSSDSGAWFRCGTGYYVEGIYFVTAQNATYSRTMHIKCCKAW